MLLCILRLGCLHLILSLPDLGSVSRVPASVYAFAAFVHRCKCSASGNLRGHFTEVSVVEMSSDDPQRGSGESTGSKVNVPKLEIPEESLRVAGSRTLTVLQHTLCSPAQKNSK